MCYCPHIALAQFSQESHFADSRHNVLSFQMLQPVFTGGVCPTPRVCQTMCVRPPTPCVRMASVSVRTDISLSLATAVSIHSADSTIDELDVLILCLNVILDDISNFRNICTRAEVLSVMY